MCILYYIGALKKVSIMEFKVGAYPNTIFIFTEKCGPSVLCMDLFKSMCRCVDSNRLNALHCDHGRRPVFGSFQRARRRSGPLRGWRAVALSPTVILGENIKDPIAATAIGLIWFLFITDNKSIPNNIHAYREHCSQCLESMFQKCLALACTGNISNNPDIWGEGSRLFRRWTGSDLTWWGFDYCKRSAAP